MNAEERAPSPPKVIFVMQEDESTPRSQNDLPANTRRSRALTPIEEEEEYTGEEMLVASSDSAADRYITVSSNSTITQKRRKRRAKRQQRLLTNFANVLKESRERFRIAHPNQANQAQQNIPIILA